MHVIEAGDVGEFKDLFIRPEGLELVKDLHRNAAPGLGQTVCIGQYGALLIVKDVRHCPKGDGSDHLFGHAKTAQRFAVLREDELAAFHPTSPRLAQFAQDGIDLT